jgi:hypothetical protein
MKSSSLSPALVVALVLLSIATLTWGQTSGSFCTKSEDCNSGLCATREEGSEGKCCQKSVADDHTITCIECDDSGHCIDESSEAPEWVWVVGVTGFFCCKIFCCWYFCCKKKNKEKKGKTSVHAVSPSAAAGTRSWN